MKKKTYLWTSIALAALLTGSVLLILLIKGTNRTNASAEEVITEYIAPNGEAYWQINAGPANAWLFPIPDGYFLIDTGYPADYERFAAGLEYAGIDIAKIQYLFITHEHDEHGGFAAQLKRDTGCTLIVPELSLEGLASGRFVWDGESVNIVIHLLGILYNKITARTFLFEPVITDENDIILSGNSSEVSRRLGVNGTFHWTPGHSEDSWSLLLDDGRAFVGDAAMNTMLALGTGYRPMFMEDRQKMYESIDLIRNSGANFILTGHGPGFSAEKLPIYKETADNSAGILSIADTLIFLIPVLIIMGILFFLTRRTGHNVRSGLYMIAFILIRDLMTKKGIINIAGDPALWFRLSSDGPLLLSLAIIGFLAAIAVILREKHAGIQLPWFVGKSFLSITAGIVAAILIAMPLLVLSIGLLPGERGGFMPPVHLPALMVIVLMGGFLEELLFRGFLQKRLLAYKMTPSAAAVTTGLISALGAIIPAFAITGAGIGLVLFIAWKGIICGLLRNRFGLTASILASGLAMAVLTLY